MGGTRIAKPRVPFRLHETQVPGVFLGPPWETERFDLPQGSDDPSGTWRRLLSVPWKRSTEEKQTQLARQLRALPRQGSALNSGSNGCGHENNCSTAWAGSVINAPYKGQGQGKDPSGVAEKPWQLILGTWNVPAVSVPNNLWAYQGWSLADPGSQTFPMESSCWIGLGGNGNAYSKGVAGDDLLQGGTRQQITGESTLNSPIEMHAWAEWYVPPSGVPGYIDIGEIPFGDLPINANDDVTFVVRYVQKVFHRKFVHLVPSVADGAPWMPARERRVGSIRPT
jgi:hypothetical protein